MSRKNRPVKEQELQKLTESYGEVSDGDEFDFPEFDASSSYSYYSSTDSQLSDFHDKDNRVENNFVNNGLVNKIDNKCYDDNKESFISKSSLFVNKSPSPSFKSQNCSKNCSESGKSVEKSETSRVNSLTKRNIRLPDCIVKSNFCPSALRNQPIRNSIPQDSNSPGKQRKHKINITSPNLNDSKFPTCSTPIRKYKENQNANVKEPGIEENNKEIQKFRDAFDSVDTDSDGRICPEELKRAFTKLGNIVTETEILRMIKEVDIDRNGTVEFNEFVVMMHHYTKFRSDHQDNDSEDSDIYDAFKAFDHNGDGFIDSDEIKRTMVALGESVSDSDVMAMIFEADADKDGKINFNEFKKIMLIFKQRAAQK